MSDTKTIYNKIRKIVNGNNPVIVTEALLLVLAQTWVHQGGTSSGLVKAVRVAFKDVQ